MLFFVFRRMAVESHLLIANDLSGTDTNDMAGTHLRMWNISGNRLRRCTLPEDVHKNASLL